MSETTVFQIRKDAIKVPRVVLGVNGQDQEVYLYYDSELDRVVISGALGLAYEQVSASGSKVMILNVTSPSLAAQG